MTPGTFADRANELMRRRQPGRNLLFVVDEVGQFVARDVQKMLDLQAIVQQLGIKGRGRHWLAVTSQEKLGELVDGVGDKRIELARLMDRFPLQVHLEPSDISEVTSQRVLAKDAAAQELLGQLFDEHRGRLTQHTRLIADFKLPETTRSGFVDLYPLLPYQIDLIIQVVSGLRTQGGLARHVGGANRTIIKLAQQLLINPAVNLADAPVGALVRLDQVYDLVEGNISSDVRAKIAGIGRTLPPLAHAVAKVICLLQVVKSVPRTAENFAAAIHPAVAADSQLAAVKEALRELETEHQVRRGEDGYRIPTPAEDDWERVRNGTGPKPGDSHRIYAETLSSFWSPQPTFTLLEAKTFKAGLAIHGREVIEGDMMFHVYLADDGPQFGPLEGELRARSRQERNSVFWAVCLNGAIDREAVELFRSKEMLSRKEREIKGEDISRLIGEERIRQRRHADDLRRLMKNACLSGSVYFDGRDYSPSEHATDVARSATEILGRVLPGVFERFGEAAAKAGDVRRGIEALLTAENLRGLPPVFNSLGLLGDEKGKSTLVTESGSLKEVLNRIEARANYGETANGRFLADELSKEPFGWDFDAVRLFVLALLRAGKIEAISKGRTIDSATSADAKDAFENNAFRQASFRPKRGIEHLELIKANDAFRETFGQEVRELNPGVVAQEIRQHIAVEEDKVAGALSLLAAHRLPGIGVLESAFGQMKVILRGSDEAAITTFNSSYRSIKDAIRRAAELEQSLTEPHLHDLERARQALSLAWPSLQDEEGLGVEVKSSARELTDLFARETFFRDLPAIEQHARVIESEYARRFDNALQARINAYSAALEVLIRTPGWQDLPEESRRTIAAPLFAGTQPLPRTAPLAFLRSEQDACEARMRQAIRRAQEMLEGERLASVQVQPYFAGGIETEEQLDTALTGLKDECMRLIWAGKKVVLS